MHDTKKYKTTLIMLEAVGLMLFINALSIYDGNITWLFINFWTGWTILCGCTFWTVLKQIVTARTSLLRILEDAISFLILSGNAFVEGNEAHGYNLLMYSMSLILCWILILTILDFRDKK